MSNSCQVQLHQLVHALVRMTLLFIYFSFSEWLSLQYVSEPVPNRIIVQRIQDFAMSRHEHASYYTVDWKYKACEQDLPEWPEEREAMQSRLDRTLNHILKSYSAAATDRDLSIIFVTHASPVNGKEERQGSRNHMWIER